MSSLLKAGRILVSEVRATVTSPSTQHPPGERSGKSSDHARIEALSAIVAELEARLAEARLAAGREAAAAHERGLHEGYEQASAGFVNDHTQQLELLASGIAKATVTFERELSQLDRLSLDIAEAAVARVIGDPSHYRDLIGRTIAHHLGELAADAALSIEVSQADFPHEDAIWAAVPELHARPKPIIRLSGDLPAGTCRVALTLGSLDIGMDTQGYRLGETFSRLRSHG
jgi:flagellar biosynthesis/type III secretory pathway protein FliH